MSARVRSLAVLLFLLLPSLAGAHEGHATGGLAHDLHHASWLVFGAALVVALGLLLFARDNEDEGQDS